MTVTETAKQTIEKAGLNAPASDYDGLLGKWLGELLDVFQKQGHSGMSAEMVSSMFRNLVASGGESLDPRVDVLESQIGRLADFILAEVPGEPSQSEGAVDTAIRIIRGFLDKPVDA